MNTPSVTREQQVIDAARATRAGITDLEIQQLLQLASRAETCRSLPELHMFDTA